MIFNLALYLFTTVSRTGAYQGVDVANTRLQRNVGAPVKEGKWPWHSYVVHTEEAISCSAVLIANDVLLTAAHCLISNKWGSTFRPVDLTAFVGVVDKLNISAGRHPINVRHIEVHQKYNDENLDYDAAIVWLDQSVRPGKHVSAVRIGQRIPRDGTICFSTGFGQTNASRESSKLREIVVPYVSWDRCGQLVGGIRDSNLTKSMACAGNVTGGLDACPGDSGGPLVCQLEDNSFELQGITSWGNNTQCGEPSYTPGVYTCIPFISEWILGHPNISAQSSVLVPNRNYFCPPALHGNQSIALPNGENLEVFCDGKTDSGGWLIVERRQVDPTYLYLIIERNHLYCGSSLSKDPFEKFCISNKHLQILTANLTLELMLDIKLCDGKVFRLISDYLVFSNLDNILLTMIATAFVDFSDIVTFFNWTLVTAEYHRDKGEFNDFEQEPLGCDIPQPSNFVWYTKSKYLTRTTIWMLEVKIRPMSYLPAASTRTVIFPVDTAVSKTVGERDKRTKCSKTVSVDKRCDDRANMSKQLSDGLVYEKDFVFVCDLQTLGGGWTVIQRRYHGDTSFNRNWKDYAEGFGNGKTGEDFWIGNRLLHLLTEQRGEMEMLVELNMCDGTSLTKRYRNVRVGSEDSDFTLDSLREDGVDAANARLFAVKSPFATYEDRRGDNCVTQMGGGGWWYKSCATFLNVNGKFGCHIPYPKGNFLIDDVAKVKRRLFVNTTRIMIRRRREKSTPRTFRDRLNANMFLKFEIPFQPRSGLNFLCRNKRQHCYDLWKNHGVKTNGLQRNISLSTDIAPDGVSALFVTDLYCDMSDTLNGPGWTVIMRRTDGQESFSRDWIDYADGFGKPERDFWLGNRLLWILTSWDFFDLHLSITLCNETKVSRLYHNFGVGHELFRFPVTLDLPDGNDELWGSGGQRFYAANLGNSLRNCGNTNGGAGWWWYGTDCTNANINGPYGCEELYPANMYWRDIGGSKGDTQVIESVTMKIRPMESALKLKQLKGMQFETYKYHVLVMGRNNCSGVIVAADIVLSSARCLSPDLTNITVVPGGLANNANAPQRKVKRVAIHRAYSSGDLTYDIAIAWLYTPITSTNVSLLLNNSIPTSAPNATDNKKIVCFTPTFATPSWQNLKSKMQQHLIYQFLYYPQYEDSPSFVVELCQRQFVCTSDFDRSVYGCPGDNGAPLICWSPTTYRFELVGLSVWQNYTVCGKPTATPLVYVRLSNVYEWIRNLTGI